MQIGTLSLLTVRKPILGEVEQSFLGPLFQKNSSQSTAFGRSDAGYEQNGFFVGVIGEVLNSIYLEVGYLNANLKRLNSEDQITNTLTVNSSYRW